MSMWAMMGLQGMQALMGAKQAGSQAAAQKLQFEEAEFQRRWQNQIENRNIAKQNALRWFQNKEIAQVANKRRAEEEFYIRYNWDNQTGAFGRKHRATQDEIYSRLHGKNINPKSGTARALLRQHNQTSKDMMTSMRISVANQLIGTVRRQDQALAQRDFGYNEHVPFLPSDYQGPDPSSAFQASLVSGLIGGAANTMGYMANKESSTSKHGTTYNLLGSIFGGASSGK